ncbi:hypothetical protein HER10_EVM0000448 [Colletotrichum scovillei]|uniref:uncharacterized protein n=1 Tax=Colletotrichum scovillei TaxID=1209932 RepID=UPI0015C343C8|nr:uncharacterized protein HER10_EVM0000448 [Colletotrichum scovillei]KAF4773016.1 hypothetical protein HER10_EVM0000448 [Colletotrichum scovillei]
MKPRSILKLLFLPQLISASVQSFDDENDLSATWCFTYLSTYLEPTTIAAAASATSLVVSPSTTSRSTASVTSGLLQDTSTFSRTMSTTSSVAELLIPLNSGPSTVSFITVSTPGFEPLFPSTISLTLPSPSLSPSLSSSMLSSLSPSASISPSLSPSPSSTTTFLTQTSTRTESTTSTSARFSNSTSVETSTFSASISDTSSSTSSSLTTSLSSSSSIITPSSSITTSTSSSLSSSSTSAAPSCTPGSEFAAYVFDRLSAPCQELIRVLADSTKNPRNLNLTLLTQGRSPLGSGVTPLVSWTNNPNQANNPTDIYGVRGPTGTTWSNSCEVIQHRGYLKFNQAGTFTITIDVPDDYGFVWLGGSASSTAPPFSASGSQLVGDGFLRQSIRNYDLVIANTQTYVPFRAWFANAGGPGHFNMPLPAGVEFVATCPDKSATPVFPLWAAERWSL